MGHKWLNKCPRCKHTLESGLLADTSNIFWHSKNKETKSIIKKIFNSILGERLCQSKPGTCRKTDAELCRSCGLVIFTSNK